MDEKLYYCKYWQYKIVKVEDNKYSICVSPKINGNNEGSTIQYHGIIIKDKEVATLRLLKNNISNSEAVILLSKLEDIIRRIFYSNLEWKENVLDSKVVKIWYYSRDGELNINNVSDKRLYPPLRFAITSVNVKPMDNATYELIKSNLEIEITNWIRMI